MTTRRKKPTPAVEPGLDEGDWITESISMQVPGDYETWVKVEAGTHVRPGEDYRSANERLFLTVGEMLDRNIDSLLGD